MYPAQTSMLPVQVALARFLEEGGNVFSNYPYWYLETTPFRYLTGPILPQVLVIIPVYLKKRRKKRDKGRHIQPNQLRSA